ncbi:MFS general substrate transporter [Byssothecium circinans]|uniref:MFS general substrate transporter n=1 Tax=Byssothecium circinans TaxID=147558 RepID=A0A6A5UJ23_9PLEO|nr:MFS general substrate transporter [Byssothecium circinans]
MDTKTSGEKVLHESPPTQQDDQTTHDVWNRANDQNRPRNWSIPKKWIVTAILSGFAFVQPLSETMLAPVRAPLSSDLSITRSYQWMLVNSLILIGVGCGPLLIAPVSEIFGRRVAVLCGTAVFIIWNTCCGFATNLGQMLAFRLLSGFGACTADAVAGGVIGDIWAPHQRGRAFAVFMVAPLLGPGVGPIAGAYISDAISWRWTFWITSIVSSALLVLAVIFLEETFEPRLAKLHSLQPSTSEDTLEQGSTSHPTSQIEQLSLWAHIQRPARMLATQPIIQLIAVYMALLYGTMFLFLYMYSTLWTKRYGQSARISSLNYVSAAIGFIAGVLVAGHLNDKVYSVLRARSANNKGRPEFRVPVMLIGTLLIPAGLIEWGWTGETHQHWILPNIGCVIYTAGCYICSSCVSVYTIDAYTTYAASAVSTNLVLRSTFSAFFPMFAPYMFDAVGYGYGATILAGVFGVVGCTTVVVLWRWGERIRSKSTYCAAVDHE